MSIDHSEKSSRETALDSPIRIALVEDHAIVRHCLRLALQIYPYLRVVGEAGNRTAALEMGKREQPDIILLDLELGWQNSLDFLPELLVLSGARVIVLTGLENVEMHQRALLLGAKGILIKTEPTEFLVRCIQRVHGGETLHAARLSQQDEPEEIKIAALTMQERAIISLLGQGRKTPQIAETLGLSETATTLCVQSIFEKLQVPDEVALVIYAYRHHLAQPLK